MSLTHSNAPLFYDRHAAIIGGAHEAEQVFTFLPGIHSLANFHNVLGNVMEGGLTRTPTDRYSDPLVGSFSNYHDFTYIASTDIERGQEIFTKSTDEWFEKAKLPPADDYATAFDIVVPLLDYHKKYKDISEAQWIDILYRLKEELIQTPGVAQLIPKTLEDLLKVEASSIEEAVLEPRSLEWVKETGKSSTHST
jgi:hypothetical protein